jgi:hypothetical protein
MEMLSVLTARESRLSLNDVDLIYGYRALVLGKVGINRCPCDVYDDSQTRADGSQPSTGQCRFFGHRLWSRCY